MFQHPWVQYFQNKFFPTWEPVSSDDEEETDSEDEDEEEDSSDYDDSKSVTTQTLVDARKGSNITASVRSHRDPSKVLNTQDIYLDDLEEDDDMSAMEIAPIDIDARK